MKECTNDSRKPAAENDKKRHRPSVAAGLWIIKRIERALIRLSRLPDQPWFEPERFDWTRVLEENAPTIRAELDEIMKHPDRIPNFQDISKDQANITRDDRWKTFFLHGYGYRMADNCELCPETARIAESIPGMYTAFFSILAPGKHIPMHRGPYKGLLRCHLALIVPEPAEECWIEVGGDARNWAPGRCLIFDDTYRHRVENNTDQSRVVLFLDIKRPMKPVGTLLNNIVLGLIRLSPFIRDAIRNEKTWRAQARQGNTMGDRQSER